MADIDTDLSGLWWLSPRRWQDTGPNQFLEGQRVRQEAMRLGQQESQFRRQQVMDMLNYNLREKEANVRMTSEIQAQKEYHDYLDDVPKLNALLANPDADMPKDFKSAKAITQAEQIRRHSERQTASEEGDKRSSD